EAPALGFHACNQPIEPSSGLGSHPVRGKVACGEERQGRAQRCADEVEDAAPPGAEEHAAGPAEDRARDEENRPESKERDVAERRPQAEIAYRAFDQRRIETIPIECQPDCRTRDSEPERQARE